MIFSCLLLPYETNKQKKPKQNTNVCLENGQFSFTSMKDPRYRRPRAQTENGKSRERPKTPLTAPGDVCVNLTDVRVNLTDVRGRHRDSKRTDWKVWWCVFVFFF